MSTVTRIELVCQHCKAKWQENAYCSDHADAGERSCWVCGRKRLKIDNYGPGAWVPPETWRE